MLNKSKLALGSVQWGSEYGISNKDGITPIKEVQEILNISKNNGIDLIDTAHLYGSAEANLGKLQTKEFRFITKTPKFLSKRISNKDIKLLETIFNLSLSKLNLKKIYGLLIHEPKDLLKSGGELLIKKMIELKDRGLVKKIGISIYNFEILDKISDFFLPDIVQLPLNIFDQEIYLSGGLSYLKSKGIEIHARSIFMQGLLLMELNELPEYFYKWKKKFLIFEEICKKNDFTKLEAALNFINNIEEVDRYILGFNNAYQLKQTLEGFNNSSKVDFSNCVIKDKDLINPQNWKI